MKPLLGLIPTPRWLTAERDRRRSILADHADDLGVGEWAHHFGVSEATIRRDLLAVVRAKRKARAA